MRAITTLFLLLIPFSLASAEDLKYKSFQPRVGTVIQVQMERTFHSLTETPSMGILEESQIRERKVYYEKILQVKKGRAIKFKRSYRTWNRDITLKKAHRPPQQRQIDLPLQGKTVLFTRTPKGIYHFKLESGRSLSSRQKKLLKEEAERREESIELKPFFPDKNLQSIQKWSIPLFKVISVLGFSPSEIKRASAFARGRLLKIYPYKDSQMGEIELLVHLPFKEKTSSQKGPGSLKLRLEGKICLDGTSPREATTSYTQVQSREKIKTSEGKIAVTKTIRETVQTSVQLQNR